MRRSAWCAFVVIAVPLLTCAGDVVINEIHFQPNDKTVPEEFIEIHNRGAEPADLSAWFFSDAIRYVFPEGTVLPPGGYLIVAEDPNVVQETLRAQHVVGCYQGRLANEGELVRLRNAHGTVVDTVEYGVGFPWPILSGGKGSSLELINPGLDNALAANWRPSGLVDRPDVERRYFVPSEATGWHYRKGTAEPSEPLDAWRQLDFVEDDTWLVGQAGFGYGDADDNTVLDDMRNGYSTIYLRYEFTVDSLQSIPEALKLGLFSDDGAMVWINGVEVARDNVPTGELSFDGTADRSREAAWNDAYLPDPAGLLRVGRNLLAVHAANISSSNTDFSIDVRLYVPGADDVEPAPPTPGRRNSVFSENASPAIRQVMSVPRQPPAEESFRVTALITDPDGVAEVSLSYQIVLPGDYLPAFLPLPHQTLVSRPLTPRSPNPAFEHPDNWTTVSMSDDGSGGDEQAGDSVYTVILPGQVNRTLVRYRITAADANDRSVRVPYTDDTSLNFACFIYNGVPPYATTRMSVHPEGTGHVYSAKIMNSLPVYHLITRKEHLQACIAYNSSYQIPKSNEEARDKFNWEGAFVYEGVAYDHVRYRLRQANDRYGLRGKRSFRVRFNKGHRLQARDNYGRKYPYTWRTLNTGKMFDNKDVGNFGLTETMNHILWNLVGVPAPWVHTFHFRIVQGPDEAPATALGQYYGDFYGMHLNFEDYDPIYLDTHELVDGNLFKLKDGIFNGLEFKRNQGRYAVKTDADFQNIRHNLRPTQTPQWLNAHVNYAKWYPYHAVVEAVRHYDFKPADSHSKNRAWYFEPYPGSQYGRLWTMPWDSDASWGPNWNSGIDYSKNAIVSGADREPFRIEYRNVLREFRDLVWTEEVIHQMIDDLAAFVADFHMADRDRWRSAPADAGSQDFGPLDRKVLDMKRFAFVGWSGSTGPTVPAGGRARHLENLANAGGDATRIPATPAAAATGPAGYPIDALTFRSSEFSDPQGERFGAIKWRIGEITPPGTPFNPRVPRVYEWPAVWEQERRVFTPEVTVPSWAVKVGAMYRVRVRMKDETGRWSHWSAPVQFTAGPPSQPIPQREALRITELMFYPPDEADVEFLEICNTGGEAVDLTGVRVREGIEFSFEDSDVTSLEPGFYVVIVKNRDVFDRRYAGEEILVAGEYRGELSDLGERIGLVYGQDVAIQDFAYDGEWYAQTAGGGHSLVIRDEAGSPDQWKLPEGWRPSALPEGSPGDRDPDPAGGLQRPGDVNQDGRCNVSDAVVLVRYLFLGLELELPCGGGAPDHPSNRSILDIDGDGNVGIGDSMHLLLYLFQSGSPPALGSDCVFLPECPDRCRP